jgi:hypothetical protein
MTTSRRLRDCARTHFSMQLDSADVVANYQNQAISRFGPAVGLERGLVSLSLSGHYTD